MTRVKKKDGSLFWMILVIVLSLALLFFLPGIREKVRKKITGYTAQAALDAIRYYGGVPVGVCAIFACMKECDGFPVYSIYNTNNVLDDYINTSPHECPLCKAGLKLDAMVNAYGISSF